MTNAIDLLWNTPSVMARFENTGSLPLDIAIELGVVGPVARASGMARDVRLEISRQEFFVLRKSRFRPVRLAMSSPALLSGGLKCSNRSSLFESSFTPSPMVPKECPSARFRPTALPLRSMRVGAARCAMSPLRTRRGILPVIRSSIRHFIIGPHWPMPCVANRFRISRFATRVSIYPIAGMTFENVLYLARALMRHFSRGGKTLQFKPRKAY